MTKVTVDITNSTPPKHKAGNWYTIHGNAYLLVGLGANVVRVCAPGGYWSAPTKVIDSDNLTTEEWELVSGCAQFKLATHVNVTLST